MGHTATLLKQGLDMFSSSRGYSFFRLQLLDMHKYMPADMSGQKREASQ